MKITKELLLKIINEQQELGEMAHWIHPVERNIYDEDGNHVGFRLKHGDEKDVRHSAGVPAEASIVIYTCGQEVKEFIRTHQKELTYILKQHIENEGQYRDFHKLKPKIIFTTEVCTVARGHGNKKILYDEDGNRIYPDIPQFPYKQLSSHQLKEAIHRKFIPILAEYFIKDEDFNNGLRLRTIPTFKVRVRENEDKHDVESTNRRVHYATRSYTLYESAQDFLYDVMNNVTDAGMEVNKIETHIPRNFNKIYRNWKVSKKNAKKYYGETPKYKLNMYGYEKDNYDVLLMTNLDILGTFEGMEFTWKFVFTIYNGKKLPTDESLSDTNVKVFRQIEHEKIIHVKKISPKLSQYLDAPYDTLTGGDGSIMDNAEIVNGLNEALMEFQQKILEIKPEDAFEIANYFEFELGQEELNESIKGVIKEMGIKRKIRIKESDFKKAILNSMSKGLTEQEAFDDFITNAKKNNNELQNEPDNNKPQSDDIESQNGEETSGNLVVALGKDNEGNYYVVKNPTSNPQILLKTK